MGKRIRGEQTARSHQDTPDVCPNGHDELPKQHTGLCGKKQRAKTGGRVRLGGEKMLALAREQGYRDGSGLIQVVKWLERTAQQDAGMGQRLPELARKAKMS
ncbi:MAG: hypothetical protein ACLPT4_14495 [Verrucomicrobiia bacterium]